MLSGAQHHWSLAASVSARAIVGLQVLLVDSSDREPRRSKNRNLPGGNRVDPICRVSVRVNKALAGLKGHCQTQDASAVSSSSSSGCGPSGSNLQALGSHEGRGTVTSLHRLSFVKPIAGPRKWVHFEVLIGPRTLGRMKHVNKPNGSYTLYLVHLNPLRLTALHCIGFHRNPNKTTLRAVALVRGPFRS